MTPPLSRPHPKGRSIASIVERNVKTVGSGVPLLEHTVHRDSDVNGMVTIDGAPRPPTRAAVTAVMDPPSAP